ncbi:MAG: hypothetical protein ABI239_08295 [Aquihabitans sp.]
MNSPRTVIDLNGPEAIDRRLAAATSARCERDRILTRFEAATEAVGTAHLLVEARRQALADETEDVRRLDSFSLSRVLSGLFSGDKPDRQKEIDEREAARYEVARAEDAEVEAVRAMAKLRDRLYGLGDVDAEWERAAAAKEAWITEGSDDRARALSELAERIGPCESQRREVAEALEAGAISLRYLEEVAVVLDMAAGMQWDDLFSDGVGATTEQRQHLDQMANLLRITQDSLRTLYLELSAVEGVREAVPADGWHEALEAFFDDIFSNLSIRSRIGDAIERVALARSRVERCLEVVRERSALIETRLEALEAERIELLADPIS